MSKMRRLISAWLNEKPAAEAGGFDAYGFARALEENRAWYHGDAAELQAVYEREPGTGGTPFWAARGTTGVTFRKIHSGLPALMVDTLAEMVCNDLQSIKLSEPARNEAWGKIAEENGLERLLKRAVKTALAQGDGAFRVTMDPGFSKLPVIEFFGAGDVLFTYERGRITETVFATTLNERGRGGRVYTLLEIYGPGYVRYAVKDGAGGEHGTAAFEETRGLEDVTFGGGVCLAAPLMFDESAEFEGRGRSVFEGKKGALDGLDEVISQWIDSLRDGRAKTYIPAGLLPRHPHSGAVMRPNGFDGRFIQTATDMAEGAANRIEVVQADIPTAALAESYSAFLDLCLQGIIAPSTLGIDMKKTDNAAAQREKEKATLYMRNKLVGRLRPVLTALARAAVAAWEMGGGGAAAEYDVTVSFGEYGCPSFEEQAATVAAAVRGGIMSAETAVRELWGEVWTEEDILAEAGRIAASPRPSQ